MIALIDLDSLIYKAKYKIEETSIIESLSGVLTNERLEDEIISQSLHRLENMYLSILEEVEETGIVRLVDQLESTGLKETVNPIKVIRIKKNK